MSSSDMFILKSVLNTYTYDLEISGRKSKLLRAIINAGDRGLTSLDLARAEFLAVPNLIAELRKYPIFIDTTLVTVKDKKGDWRERVARYRYCGCCEEYQLIDPSRARSTLPRLDRSETALLRLQAWLKRLRRTITLLFKERNPGSHQANTGFRESDALSILIGGTSNA